MTKSQYVRIASVVRGSSAYLNDNQKAELTHQMVLALEPTSPTFDREAFEDVCK